MLTLVSKTFNYISSYLILYPLLMIRVIFTSKFNGWTDKITSNLPLLILLSVFFILSIIWMSGLLRWKNNTRINGIVMKNNTIYAASYITTYIVPLVFIEMNLTGFVVSIVLFIVIGAIFIYSDKHLPNPTFFMFGYKTYEIDDKNILFQGSLDMLNIELIESPHGISARELTKNTYIVLPQ